MSSSSGTETVHEAGEITCFSEPISKNTLDKPVLVLHVKCNLLYYVQLNETGLFFFI